MELLTKRKVTDQNKSAKRSQKKKKKKKKARKKIIIHMQDEPILKSYI